MQNHISRAEAVPRIARSGAASVPATRVPAIPVNVVIVTLDSHLATPAERARESLVADIPGLRLTLHAASDWAEEPASLDRAKADIADADVIIATMLFMEDHIEAIRPALEARRPHCDAMVCCMAAGEIVKLTRMGDMDMTKPATGAMGLLKRLRGTKKPGQGGSGAGQMKMLRRLPKILRYIPGKAQDLRAYFLTMQYWLAGSEENVGNLIRFLVNGYSTGPRAVLRGRIKVGDPVDYPDTGVYHPSMDGLVSDQIEALPGFGARSLARPAARPAPAGTVGVLLMRSYLLARDTAHYDAVISTLEARGLRVVPAFASGLDARPAIEAFFRRDGRTTVDAVVSLTGFSLVGGPAYNDSAAAEDVLAGLDVPYLAAHALEFQPIETWGASARGLSPVEATMMVAIPEIDGASGPMVFGGRTNGAGGICTGCARHCSFAAEIEGSGRTMLPCPDRIERLVGRVERLVSLRRSARAERKLAVVLYGFPPNAGAVGTAAYLGVFESLFNTLGALKSSGYDVAVPDSVDDLRAAILVGNSARYGQQANVHTTVSSDRMVRTARHLDEIEKAWGPVPGRQQSDGTGVFILGAQFGNVFVGVQPAFGYEGDPMRLLFEGNFAPTHAFAAFYRWMADDFAADAVLHFGTHGALEFMPGKQTGLSGGCWPDRLIGDLPNIYLYAANNPSEGTIAKRRSAATTVSHLTPSLSQAGLYKGLLDLKASVERWRTAGPQALAERTELEQIIQDQAAAVDLAPAAPVWNGHAGVEITALWTRIQELEQTLIPHGLHVLGVIPPVAERADTLTAMAGAQAEALDAAVPPPASMLALAEGRGVEAALVAGGLSRTAPEAQVLRALAKAADLLAQDHEIPALIHALDGRFVRPVSGGDLIRSPDILPTGRNIHGFDPYRLPSAYAMRDGARQAERLLARHQADGNPLPGTVAVVLWGTDNLKSEGGPIAQALALMGAEPRFDGYGRLTGARLIPLADLGRPRIDVMITLSGIFRDLLPLQTRLLAEAAFLAASADEPLSENHVRAHTLAAQAKQGCDFETAALRVFSNADGAYGANVNQLIDSGAWGEEDELADMFEKRKCFAYGRDGRASQRPEQFAGLLAGVDLAYQNLESVELGVTTVDHYFDTLGGIGRAVRRARGVETAVYIGDQTRGDGKVRTLKEQVGLETRTRALNPKWYEGMLKHGHEGVRQIEAQVTNTVGWSATTGAVDPWVYQRLSETFVLDPEMRRRMAELNPVASARMTNRLIEAHERAYWTPDPEMLAALTAAGEELEDRLEGLDPVAA